MSTLSILVLMIALADDTSPGGLVPIEQGIIDQSATATSLKVQPVELSQSTNFQKLFGVAGRPDLFVRSQGGLFAVFDQGSYRKVQGKTFVQWPAGTVYYIGQPDFMKVKSSGVRIGQSGVNPPPGIALQQKYTGAADMRVGTVPEEGLIQSVSLDGRVMYEPVSNKKTGTVQAKDAGFGHHSIPNQLSPAALSPHVVSAPATDKTNSSNPQQPPVAQQPLPPCKDAAAKSPTQP